MKERIQWIDTAKGIGLLCVIIGHLHIPFIATWVYTFHMPLFFFLSGVVFSGNKYDLQSFLVKKVKTLIVPYFSLGIVIYFFYMIINEIRGVENSLYGSNYSMLIQLLKQEHFWTIWFLTCLFFTEILYYLINRYSNGNGWIATGISLTICLLGFFYYRMGGDGLPWNLDVAFIAQFFLHLGYRFSINKKINEKILTHNRINSIILAVIFLIINIVSGILCIKVSGESLDMSVGLYGDEILTIISAVGGILFIVIVSNHLVNKYLVYLGQNTMIIFAWHSRIIIVLCNYIFDWLKFFQTDNIGVFLLKNAFIFVIIFAILIPVTELIKKAKIHAWFGV